MPNGFESFSMLGLSLTKKPSKPISLSETSNTGTANDTGGALGGFEDVT